jgi:DNA (cytosine-5)-methyltransferase 1
MTGRYTAAEIFAGGGGLATGLRNAGFQTLVAVEIEPHAAATFKANHPEVQVFRQDVRTISGETISDLADGSLDVLAACPPCQGFSTLTTKWNKADSRNELVSEVARLAEKIRPRAIMVENVPGLAQKGKVLFDALVERLIDAGYICNWDVLQVADYGVPQKRRRLVLLAGLGFKIALPAPTHSRTGVNGRSRWKTVRDTIADMEDAIPFVEAQKLGGAQAFNWHVVRRLSPENVARIRLARPGAVWKLLPAEIRPICHQGEYEGFTNVYGRLSWDQPSATITAGCTTLSKGRFGHPEYDRTLSLREAALLQTFPPDYRFDTPHFERACEIVGNALPCVFAEAIARAVASALDAAGPRNP